MRIGIARAITRAMRVSRAGAAAASELQSENSGTHEGSGSMIDG